MKYKCLTLTFSQPNLKKKSGRTKCKYWNSSPSKTGYQHDMDKKYFDAEQSEAEKF